MEVHMTNRKTLAMLYVFIFAFSIFLAGCSDDDPSGPGAPDPPAFTLSSLNVGLAGGVSGIQYFARTDKDISLIRVNITNPIGGEQVFNAGGEVFLSNELIGLQEDGTGYVRVSGAWTFRFVGNHEPTKESFDITQTLSVSAKVPAE